MVDYKEVFELMKNFNIPVITYNEELIFDIKENVFIYIGDCKDIEDVKVRIVLGLSRPICKGLKPRLANELLRRFNKFFGCNLTKKDFYDIYLVLCYYDKESIENCKKFMRNNFDMEGLHAGFYNNSKRKG